jgi:hypothetical protein
MVHTLTSRVTILRVLGGLFIVLAGLVYYLGITIASSASLVFIVAGIAVVLLALSGHRARGRDAALFVIGLLLLAAVISPGIGPSQGSQSISHTVTSLELQPSRIQLIASTDTGGISVSYSAKSNLAYQVNFTRSSFAFGIFGSIPFAALSNETRDGFFVLNATAHSYGISVAVGTGYVLNVLATAGTGSITVNARPSERLGVVSLKSGTGSVTANLTCRSVGDVELLAGTGSVNLESNHFAPNGTRIPVKLHAGIGSANLDVRLANGTAVLLEASAGFGSVNQDLQGFTASPQSTRSNFVAQSGEVSAAGPSFIVQASTGTGSVTVKAQFLG